MSVSKNIAAATLLMAGIAEAQAPANKILTAYYPSWGIYSNVLPKKIADTGAASRLTHLNYAFANITGGRCAVADPQADYLTPVTAAQSLNGVADGDQGIALRGNFHQLQLLKQKYPQLKVVMSIGGEGSGAKFTSAVADIPGFVTSCVDLFIKGRITSEVSAAGLFDGIDIDWEYPTAAQTRSFTDLLAEFRRQLNAVRPGLILSAATPGGQSEYQNMALGLASQSVDYFGVMSYDYNGPWSQTTGFAMALKPSANDPGSANYNVDKTIAGYMAAGVPSYKILMGVTFDGYRWNGVSAGNQNGLFQGGTPVSGGIPYSRIIALANFTKFRDAASQAPYLFNGSSFITFDDDKSLAEKADYANAQALGGMMVWDLPADTDDAALIGKMAATLSTATTTHPAMPPAPAPSPAPGTDTPDTALFNFEAGPQGWTAPAGGLITSVRTSDSVAYAGIGSLAINFSGTVNLPEATVSAPATELQAGTTVQFHLWVPAGNKLASVNVFVEDRNWQWASKWLEAATLTPNAWNTVSVTIPANAAMPLSRIGVEFTSSTVWSGMVYLDSMGPSMDRALYSFEGSLQGWTASGVLASVSASTTYAGNGSLAVTFGQTNFTASAKVFVPSPQVQPGQSVEFRVWVPAGSRLTAINPYAQDRNWAWSGDWQSITSLRTNAWNTFRVQVPATAAGPLEELGIEFTSSAAWSGVVYVDAVNPR